MNRKSLPMFFTALIILPLLFVGCKGRTENPPESQMTEAPGIMPGEGEVGVSVTEPAESIATEMIPPTAAPEVRVKPKASPLESIDRNKEIQKALKNAGFYAGAIDGKIGPKTKKAIQEFQNAKGLKVDGKVGPRTWAELEKYLTQ